MKIGLILVFISIVTSALKNVLILLVSYPGNDLINSSIDRFVTVYSTMGISAIFLSACNLADKITDKLKNLKSTDKTKIALCVFCAILSFIWIWLVTNEFASMVLGLFVSLGLMMLFYCYDE